MWKLAKKSAPATCDWRHYVRRFQDTLGNVHATDSPGNPISKGGNHGKRSIWKSQHSNNRGTQ
jgi:hypothetical protein